MTNYKSRRPPERYSKLRAQHIQKGDGWTPLPFCGTGLSYTVSDSAGCDVFGRRMVPTTTMNAVTPRASRIILSHQRITQRIATAENTPNSTPYTRYTNSMIPHTKYDLSYYCMTTTVRGCGVAA